MKAHKTDKTQSPSRTWRRFFILSAVSLLALAVIVPSAQARPIRGAITGNVNINFHALYTTSTTVTINSAMSGATQMQFRNAGGSWSNWESYKTTKTWTLPTGDGVKTIEMQYKAKFAAIVIKSASIALDTTAPATTSNYDGLPHTSFTLALTSADTLSGVAATEYRLDGGSWQTGSSLQLRLKIQHKLGGLNGGNHVVEYRSSDAAGNVESTQSITVTLGL